jgi:hypothetical protein
MHKDIDLRARVQTRLHHRLERRLDRRRQFQRAPALLILIFFFSNKNEGTHLSPRPRRRRSLVLLNGAMVASTCMEARSCRVWARTRASRGPNTLTSTSVSPCATRADPSAPAWAVESKVISRSSYCLRPSERNPPSFRISMRELCCGWDLSVSRWGGGSWYLPFGQCHVVACGVVSGRHAGDSKR